MTNVIARPMTTERAASGSLTSLGAGRTRLKWRWFCTELVLTALTLVCVAFALRTVRDWGDSQLRTHIAVSIAATAVWGVVLVRQRLYQARFISTRLQEWRRLLHAGGLATLVVLALGSLTLEADFSRGWVLVSAVSVFVVLLIEREVVRHLFGRARRSGRMLRDVVIVGDNPEGAELRAVIEASPELGYRFVALVDSVPELDDFLSSTGADNVIIAGSAVEPSELKAAARSLVSRGIHVELSPVLPDTSIERVTLHQLGPHPLVYLEPAVQSGTSAAAKRAFDIAFSGAALLAALPVMLVTAAVIKLESRGPVFFRQTRLGHHGQRFEVLKFRSMHVGAETRRQELAGANESSGPLFKMAGDPRVTRFGRLIRRLGIDEIPQFWNVLRGDMSVVGPRPALPDEARAWPPELHHRLRARPGITGMWQIMGEERHDFDQYVKLDLYYVDNWSLFTDLSIVLRTIPSVLRRSGD